MSSNPRGRSVLQREILLTFSLPPHLRRPASCTILMCAMRGGVNWIHLIWIADVLVVVVVAAKGVVMEIGKCYNIFPVT